MTFNPEMYGTLKIGNSATTSRISLIDFLQRGGLTGTGDFMFTWSSTCREIFSSALAGLGRDGMAFATKIGGPNILSRITLNIRINKPLPEYQWMQGWLNTIAWPGVFKRIYRNGGGIGIDLFPNIFNDKFNEAPLSFSLFFLNRHEEFPADVIGDPDALIKYMLDGKSRIFNGNKFTSMAIKLAFVVYYTVIAKADRRAFERSEIRANGILNYISYSGIAATAAPTLYAFVEQYKIPEASVQNAFGDAPGSGMLSGFEAYRMYKLMKTKDAKSGW